MIFLLLLSCFSGAHDTGESYEFSDKWLQFDKYFEDTCFYLDSDTHKVIIYDEGENDTEEKDWHWEFFPPNLFVVDERDIMIYRDNACWDLEAYGLSAQACKCEITLPQ